MMKVVHPICCGLDVHKSLIVATIASVGESGVTDYEQRSFSTLNPDLLELRGWLLDRECPAACMESTGKYWIPVFNVLEGHVEVCLTHPKYVRAIKGKKTDKRDSKWIADLFMHGLVRSSFIPPREVRECREIARYRAKLVNMRSSEKNRYQNRLTVSNIGLGSVLSDCLGVTARGIVEHLAGGGGIAPDELAPLMKRSAKRKAGAIVDAVRGCEISPDQRFKIGAALGHMDYLDGAVEACELELCARMRPRWGAVSLLCTVPGVNELSAMLILSEIGFDMGQLGSADRLCSWAGVAPGANESAGKRKSVRVTRAGQYLKPVLVQCANAAVKSAGDDCFAVKYKRLKKRRGHKKAIVAIARMMLTCIYHMLSTGEVFNPSDYGKLGNPEPRPQALAEESAIRLLGELGYDISKSATVA